jgi:hypothetical protein
MASEIRVNKINSRTGVGTITLSPTGVDFTGIATVATLKATTGIVTTLTVTDTTTLNGVTVTGRVTCDEVRAGDDDKIQLGDSQDFRVYHDGSTNIIDGHYHPIELRHQSEVHAKFVDDGAVELYHNNVKKFETKSDGVDITGELQCDTLDVDGTSVFMPGTDNSTNVVIFTGGDAARGLKLGTKGYNGLNDGGVVYNAQTGGTSGSHHFQVNNGTDMVKIDHHGLKFGSDTAAANALDDYEEGTWTPTMTFGGGTTGLTYNRQHGTYTKIGNIVYLKGHLSINAKGTSTGHADLRGFPFTPDGSSTSGSPNSFVPIADRGKLNAGSGYQGMALYLTSDVANGARFYRYKFDGSGNATVDHSNFATGSEVDVNFVYKIN